MYLFFDTETSGLPRDWSAPETDIRNWPRLIQLAWICADKSGNVTDSQVHLIKPQGFAISEGAFATHGISTEFAIANGVDLLPVLQSFVSAVNSATIVVAHNIDFDRNIIGAEYVRAAIASPLRQKHLQCTMKESTNFCGIPGSRGPKWPTLEELHVKLFRSHFANAHNALGDCLACMKCYFKLKELQVMM